MPGGSPREPAGARVHDPAWLSVKLARDTAFVPSATGSGTGSLSAPASAVTQAVTGTQAGSAGVRAYARSGQYWQVTVTPFKFKFAGGPKDRRRRRADLGRDWDTATVATSGSTSSTSTPQADWSTLEYAVVSRKRRKRDSDRDCQSRWWSVVPSGNRNLKPQGGCQC